MLLPVGDTDIELVAPRGNQGLERFLEKRGPGLHHIAVEVEGLDEAPRPPRRRSAYPSSTRSRGSARAATRSHSSTPGRREASSSNWSSRSNHRRAPPADRRSPRDARSDYHSIFRCHFGTSILPSAAIGRRRALGRAEAGRTGPPTCQRRRLWNDIGSQETRKSRPASSPGRSPSRAPGRQEPRLPTPPSPAAHRSLTSMPPRRLYSDGEKKFKAQDYAGAVVDTFARPTTSSRLPSPSATSASAKTSSGTFRRPRPGTTSSSSTCRTRWARKATSSVGAKPRSARCRARSTSSPTRRAPPSPSTARSSPRTPRWTWI